MYARPRTSLLVYASNRLSFPLPDDESNNQTWLSNILVFTRNSGLCIIYFEVLLK